MRYIKGFSCGGLSLALILAGLLMVGGCNTPHQAYSELGDISPYFESITMSGHQRRFNHARTLDLNARAFWDDLDHVFYLDRPRWLTYHTIP